MVERKKQRKKSQCPVRNYKIDGVTYIVTARHSARATEDAKTKIMRLIVNDARHSVSSNA
jgi:hypothetical protein